MLSADTLSEQEEKMFGFENALISQGYQNCIGLDEVGRGPLAGPVVACALMFKENPQQSWLVDIKDSKKLSEKKRDLLFDYLINDETIFTGLGLVDPKKIDEINILQASLYAMKCAKEDLESKYDLSVDACLVDGNQTIDTKVKQFTFIKGDDRILSIAAASIVAKVTRDKLMCDYDKMYPSYGFAKHKGYGTKVHREAISQFGLTDIHRKSFKLKL